MGVHGRAEEGRIMIEIQLRGLEIVEKYFVTLPDRTNKALKLAVNDAALFGARLGKKQIMAEVNRSSAYLGDPKNITSKLARIKTARANDLESIVEAKHRPASLAGFSSSPVSFGRPKAPIKVKVGKGGYKKMERAFFIRLNPGKTKFTEDNYNLGLAIRLRPGEDVGNKKVHVSQDSRIAVLYGPSVEQMFNRITPEIADDVLAFAEREFLRQFDRLKK